MPEMPETEALARFLTQNAMGRRVDRVRAFTVQALKTVEPKLDALEGRTIGQTTRYGKFLAIATERDGDAPIHLVVHFALAGWLRWYDEVPSTPVKPGGYINLRLRLDDGSGFDLTEAGTKHALAIHVVRDPQDVPGIATLGPDALSLDLAGFARLLEGRRQGIKNLLRDQKVIGGVGNAYSDEILHAARMSPFKPAKNIAPHDLVDLYEAMGSILRGAIEEASGRPPAELKDAKRSSMRVHGRDGEACPECGDTVRSVKYQDRSFQYCPTCQTDGQPLADRVLSRLLK